MSLMRYALVPTPPVNVLASLTAVPVPAVNPVVVPVVFGCAIGAVVPEGAPVEGRFATIEGPGVRAMLHLEGLVDVEREAERLVNKAGKAELPAQPLGRFREDHTVAAFGGDAAAAVATAYLAAFSLFSGMPLPVALLTMLVGTLAIAGMPPLSGFFSKDEILWKTFSSGHVVLWVLGLGGALLTAFYMFRLVFLTFFGPHAVAGRERHLTPPTSRSRPSG